jgi:hypothetical protein
MKPSSVSQACGAAPRDGCGSALSDRTWRGACRATRLAARATSMALFGVSYAVLALCGKITAISVAAPGVLDRR